MKRINHILLTAMVLVTVAMFANADIPPAPAGLDNGTGNYWTNYTWSKDLGCPDNDNVTDSFNVSMNGKWYNGTATFLNKSVGPGGWANITIWAYNATGNGNMSVGSVSDSVQAPAMVDPPDDNPCTIMQPDSETLMEWIARYNAAPKVNISGEGVMALPDEYSVLDRLDYNATERDQDNCGNCWVWAGTGCMEVAHDAENDVFDRLSIQYLNSLYYDGTGNGYACCGGTLGKFTDFYSVNTTFTIPWDNTNASWQDGGACCCKNEGCSPPGDETAVPAASIPTTPYYTITHIEEHTITTQGVDDDIAIATIKSVLASDNAIWFGFYLPTSSDRANFQTFWNTGSKTDLWSPDCSCGHTWVDGDGGGHAVLCVGYNDSPGIEPYWIMLNSWGASANRPNGLFQMNMSINYSCCFDYHGGPLHSLEWQMLDIDFADICVNKSGWWRHGGEIHGSETPIQAAVDNADAGETICVAAGDYTENVNIGTSNLTLAGEGADVVNVRADSPSYPVFNVAADYVNISGFNVTGALNDAGIYLNGVQHCNISDNNASGNYYGIYLDSSSSNTLANNTMSGNTYNFGVDGSSLSHYTQTIYSNNTVDGKPIYYYVDQQGGQIPTSAGYVGVVNSTNIIVQDLNLAKNLQGILFVNTSDSTIENVTASNNRYGIRLSYSSNYNTLTSNNASNNDYGIWLGTGRDRAEGANNNSLTDNTANSNNNCGIYLSSSSNNTLIGNTANSNKYHGIMLGHWSNNNTLSSNTANSNGVVATDLSARESSSSGIYLQSSSNDNMLTSNAASGNYYGIYLRESSSNTLTGNTASDNSDWDIYIDDSPSNTFADNTLNGTTVSFTYRGYVSLKGVGLPAAGANGWYSIGKFINATNQSEDAWMFLNFNYSDSDFTGDMDESNITVWKYNGTWYKDGWNRTRYSDPANNIVGVNITSFSVFAPMTTGVPALHHITVEPGSDLLNIDEPPKSQTFAATGCSKHTDPIPDLMFGWSNTDTSVGGLNNSTGTVVNFTAERVGRAYLTASNGSVTSGQVQVTVDAGADNTTVDEEKVFVVTSGDATVTGSFSNNLTGWINITAIGNATNSFEVNSSNPRYGLRSGDKMVSGVIVNVSGNVTNELGENGTIRIRICYNATTLAALGIDASTLAIWKYNSTTETWVKQSSTRSEGCVYVDVDHLCTYGLFGSKAAGGGSSSTGGGGDGTYPPGWYGTPTPTVTATKAAASATGATTPAPPGKRVTPRPTKTKPAAAKATTPAVEGTTAGKPKKDAPGFTAVFVIAGMLAAVYAMMRRRRD